jgi:pimeloyl-ACP methyl ester carboxylesterase
LSKKIWNELILHLSCHSEVNNFDLLWHGDLGKSKNNSIYKIESMWLHYKVHLNNNAHNNVFVLHSMASAFIPYIIKSGIKIKALFILEGNIIPEDAYFSRRLSSMSFGIFKKWYKLVNDGFLDLGINYNLMNLNTTKRIASDSFQQVNPDALYHISKDLVSITDSGEIIDVLRKRDFPVFYFRGEFTPSQPKLNQVLKEIKIPIHIIENSGHLMMVDNPSGTYNKIKRILEDI